MSPFSLQLPLGGGSITILEEIARKDGADLLAVTDLARNERWPEEKGVLEASAASLSRYCAMTMRGTMARVKHPLLMDAGQCNWDQEWASSPGIAHEAEPLSDWLDSLTGPQEQE